MAGFGLSVQSRYSNMSDGELDRIVTTIMHQHPHCGYRMIQEFLASLGHRVQQNRVRDCLIRLDPEGVIARWNCTVHHRSYSDATPNALWHIDGNHRLIRYIAKKKSIRNTSIIYCSVFLFVFGVSNVSQSEKKYVRGSLQFLSLVHAKL